MSFSMPPAPPTPAQTPAEQQAARDKDREDYNRVSGEFRDWYNRKTKREVEHWDLVRALEDGRDLTEEERNIQDDDDDTPRISGDIAANPYPPKEGFYWYNHAEPPNVDHKDGERIFYTKNEGVRPVPGKPLTETNISACMDFVAGKLGSDTMVLNVAEYATSIYVENQRKAKTELLLMMKVAEDKGLAFEFSKGTTAALLTMLSDREFKEFRAREAASQSNREEMKLNMGVTDVKGLQHVATNLGRQHVALPGVDENEKIENLKQSVYAGLQEQIDAVTNRPPLPATPDEVTARQQAVDDAVDAFKAQKIQDYIDSMGDRLNGTEKALNRIASGMETQQGFIDKPEKLMSVNEAKNPSPENIQTNLLDRIEKSSAELKGKQAREKILFGLEKEHAVLKIGIVAWKTEIEQIRGRPASESLPGPITEKQAKLEQTLAKVLELEKKINDQGDQSNKVKQWENGGREQAITNKKTKLAEQLAERQQPRNV